jgi:hypothetical protein
VQIFQHHHKGSFNGESFEGFGHLAKHALGRGPQNFALKFFPFVDAYESGHLRKPRRGVTGEQIDDRFAARLSTNSRQGFEHWKVSFACSVLIEALAGSDHKIAVCRYAVEESFDQSGFPYPRFSRDKYNLTLATKGAVEQSFELRYLILATYGSRRFGEDHR